MDYGFDRVIDRRSTNSIKWNLYGDDVLPLWVADMDFPAPEPIQKALREAVEHGIFGYDISSKELRESVAARVGSLYNWQVSPEAVVATPGVIAGFTAAARTACLPGEGVLIQPPVYPPFLSVHRNAGLTSQMAELQRVEAGSLLRYEIDWERLEEAFNSNQARTGMFLLCNPHNPTGQAYSRDELMRIADLCILNNAIICSDEIHSELLLGDTKHIPVAALDSEIAVRTITLIAPSKTFNIAGLFCGFAIIPNPDLREKFKQTLDQMAMHVNSLGLIAAQAAFSGDCDGWLAALRIYLAVNRDFLANMVQSEFHGIRMTLPDATYLTWLDCRELVEAGKIEGSPHKFFLHKAKVAMNEGAEFGPGGEGFVRLNFGCPRRTLEEGLGRMKEALASTGSQIP